MPWGDDAGEHPASVDTLRVHLAELHAEMTALRRDVTRGEQATDRQFEALDRIGNRLDDLTTRLNTAEGRSAGASTLWAHIVATIGLILAIIAAVLAYSNNQRITEELPHAATLAPIERALDWPDALG